MGEIDTKSIESVQTALSLFEERYEERKNWLSSSDRQLEKELQGLLKDLANYKLQLEAKDSTYMQALLKLEHYRKNMDELSTQLKTSEFERDRYMEECREVRLQRDMLESKISEMTDQLTETIKIREQLSHVLNELKTAQGEVLIVETELASARDLKLKALERAQMMETASSMEQEKSEELRRHISQLSEAIAMSNLAAVEADREKCLVLAEKDVQIELARAQTTQAHEQLEEMRNQMVKLQELDGQLLAKSILIETLQQKLEHSNELLSLSEEAVSDTMDKWKELKGNIEVREGKSLDQAAYIEELETEKNQLKQELECANEEVNHLICNNELLKCELQNATAEIDRLRERETEAQVEIALVKSELHKGRSKVAAAEATEARAESVKSGLYLAVQQLAVEAGEVKKENQRLRQEVNKKGEESEDCFPVNPQVDVEVSESDYPQPKYDGIGDEKDVLHQVITVSRGEDCYESVTSKSKGDKVKALEEKLEAAMVKVGELRSRVEQAVSRAELAEKAKAAVEGQLRKWREQKQRKKAALAALREESVPKIYNSPSYNQTPTTYQPLGKVLNMKF